MIAAAGPKAKAQQCVVPYSLLLVENKRRNFIKKTFFLGGGGGEIYFIKKNDLDRVRSK